MNIQPVLENDMVMIRPLTEDDFEVLYETASDPKIWEQHPNKNRWKREVFLNFFEGAIQSGGAFLIIDKQSNSVIGSTRYYDYDKKDDSILIGYTFYGASYWGVGYNPSVKSMMLDYIFQFVSKVYFHIGADNIRSQVSIQRLGAIKVDERVVTYFGESPKLNYIYKIERPLWVNRYKK